ncbi:hypothetical protein BJY04DRAFT_220818 [Aspergillus karnatakaensis]|uniref:uncharacterized protein n=1 Tax=Aspergillus karnatakaensis TaxID=1810916 RepID=UPI003CCE4492
MSLRDKLRKVFQKHKAKPSGSGIKIEYYRRGEIPPSKFKGPFDKEHQKRLAAWSFQQAQEDRPRSMDLSLSPCTTLPDYLIPREVADAALDQLRPRILGLDLSDGVPPTSYHDEFIQDRQGTTGSLSSTTAVDPESFSDSTMTLFLDPLEDDPRTTVTDSIRNTLPKVGSTVPPPISTKGIPMPVPPGDLTRALNAVQICS